MAWSRCFYEGSRFYALYVTRGMGLRKTKLTRQVCVRLRSLINLDLDARAVYERVTSTRSHVSEPCESFFFFLESCFLILE